MDQSTKNKNPYEDIIHLEHPVSSHHPQMPIIDRAAQFSPFAALTGYEGAIKETARLTSQRIELDEYEKNILDEKLRIIQEQLGRAQEIEITYFQPDDLKTGGKYISVRSIVKKIDVYEQVVILENGTKIEVEEIVEITLNL